MRRSSFNLRLERFELGLIAIPKPGSSCLIELACVELLFNICQVCRSLGLAFFQLMARGHHEFRLLTSHLIMPRPAARVRAGIAHRAMVDADSPGSRMT